MIHETIQLYAPLPPYQFSIVIEQSRAAQLIQLGPLPCLSPSGPYQRHSTNSINF